MSTTCGENLFTFGARLREERDRLSKTQDEIASAIGTTGRTVKKYEASATSPRATELCVMNDLGMDVLYIITGVRAPLRAAEPGRAYMPAEQAAAAIAEMRLTQEDADTLIALARRLSMP